MAATTPLTLKSPNDEEAEFILAIQKFKEENRKQFPTWSEAFRVLKSLGYVKVHGPQPQEQPEPEPAKPKKSRKPRSKKDA